MNQQTQTLNQYLESKGASTDTRVKKSIATALGIPCDPLDKDREADLLRALQIGSMAKGEVIVTYGVEVAFNEAATLNFDALEKADAYASEQAKAGKYCRILKQVTVSLPIQVVTP
jgi:hypothetical protein